jgi:unsaturated rhamnogalacturonyl hydrolase
VKAGGVLVLMANDSANVELKNFNRLAQQFGIQFNHDNLNPVLNRQFEMGRILIPENHPVFPGTKKVYLKEIASLSLQEPAKPLLLHNGHIVMAQAKVGKGTVFAVGDPWLYNEYVGGWLLSNDFENFRAGKQLAGWLLEQAKKPQVTP